MTAKTSRSELLDKVARPAQYLVGVGSLIVVPGFIADLPFLRYLGAGVFLAGAAPSLVASVLIGRLRCQSCHQKFWATFRVGTLRRGCPLCGRSVFDEGAV